MSLRGLPSRLHARGFTLIEVLVALAITAIALAAGVRASSALQYNAQRQSDTLLAQICAENELVKMRLAKQMPGVGDSSSTCQQAGQTMGVTVSVYPTPNPSFRRVEAAVRAGPEASANPVLSVATIVGRF